MIPICFTALSIGNNFTPFSFVAAAGAAEKPVVVLVAAAVVVVAARAGDVPPLFTNEIASVVVVPVDGDFLGRPRPLFLPIGNGITCSSSDSSE